MPASLDTAGDAFKAGMDARGRGEAVAACPHPDGSDERKQWLEGWHKPDLSEPEELGFA